MTPRKILIVDDNSVNIELAAFTLEADGLTVCSASNASDARKAIDEDPPDLVLMDIQMPGMNGLEFTRRLKEDPATSAILILAFTAYAMKGDESRMRAAGCDGYIAKPIDVRTFAATVRTFLAD